MDQDDKPPRAVGEPEGRYANYFKIGHNALEFLFDFGRLYAGTQWAQFHARIITHPSHAKALLGLLQEAIAEYEQAFGIIHGG